jgi:protein-L-isoaspartate(D-aspartate) O-methyltransferase
MCPSIQRSFVTAGMRDQGALPWLRNVEGYQMAETDDSGYAEQRTRLVREIARQGISDSVVLDAMRRVPRERFVPERLRDAAYEDAPLPIGKQQTISQPLIVAQMTAALELDASSQVLEIGTGSGYGAAVLAQIADQVFTVERQGELLKMARQRLQDLHVDNVHCLHGDGCGGWPEHAPYDAIVVTACSLATPPALLQQLRIGGRLVVPVGEERRFQKLLRIYKRDEETLQRQQLGNVAFVPLVQGTA